MHHARKLSDNIVGSRESIEPEVEESEGRCFDERSDLHAKTTIPIAWGAGQALNHMTQLRDLLWD